MKNLILTDEEYDMLVNELSSLSGYHWNDDRIHADDCGSKILDVIASKVEDIQS